MLAFLLFTGSVFAPNYSFAQNEDESIFNIFEILFELFLTGDIKIISDGNPSDFTHATIILSSKTSSDDSHDDESEDENEKNKHHNIDEFEHGKVNTSSDTDTIGKVTLCHVSGNQKTHTIKIASPAVPAHLEHGDYEGECTYNSSNDTNQDNQSFDLKSEENHEKEHKENDHNEKEHKDKKERSYKSDKENKKEHKEKSKHKDN